MACTTICSLGGNGLLTDGLGMHSIIGAFFLGVVIPQGALNNAVQDKAHDFVASFMMPLFFVTVGERIRIQDLALDTHFTTMVVVVLLAFVAKIVCTMAVSIIWPFYGCEVYLELKLSFPMSFKFPFMVIAMCFAKKCIHPLF